MVRRGEEAVNPQGLRSTEKRVDKVNKEEAKEEIEEKTKEKALLPY